MPQRPTTQGERLARLEALQEEQFGKVLQALERNNPHPLGERLDALVRDLDEKWDEKFAALENLVRDDVADLATMKNVGRGALMVVSFVFASIGAAVTAFWDDTVKFIHSLVH